MTPSARLPALLLALAALLAGCASDPADPAATDGSATATEPGAPPLGDGSVPMDADLGAMPHLHDYWSGRERVALFDGDVEPDQDEAMNATAYRVWVERQPMVGGTGFNLPDGAIVFEGTGQMEVTATWSDPLVTSLGFSYRSAAGPEFSPVQPLASGQAHVIQVSPDMTDMPHMSTSRWSFVFSPSEPGAALGPFQLKVEIVKMRDVSLFPGHPDLFAGAHEKVLHDESHEFTQVSYARRVPDLLLTSEFGETTITPRQIVPMETRWMKAEVDVERAESLPGEIVDVRFFFHGADTTYLGHPYWIPTKGSFAEGRLEYEWPVSMEMTDTPYGNESQWRFLVEPVTSFTGQDPPCGGCTDTTFGFRLKLTAYDSEQPGPASKREGEGGSG